MSQSDLVLQNDYYPQFWTDLNEIISALATSSGGLVPPSTTHPNQFWYNQTLSQMMIRNTANTEWGVFSGENLDGVGGTVTVMELITDVVKNYTQNTDVAVDTWTAMGNESNAIQCRSVDENWFLSTIGTILFNDLSGSPLNPITTALGTKFQYSYSSGNTGPGGSGPWSAWTDCGDVLSDDIYISINNFNNSRHVLTSINVDQDLGGVTAGAYLKFRVLHKSEILSIKSRLKFELKIQALQSKSAQAVVAEANTSSRGASKLSSNSEAIAGTSANTVLTPATGKILVDSQITTGERVPGGGANNYILTKTSAANGAVGWAAPIADIVEANTTVSGKSRFSTNSESTGTGANTVLSPLTGALLIDDKVPSTVKIPIGGISGQALIKSTGDPGDVEWASISGNSGVAGSSNIFETRKKYATTTEDSGDVNAGSWGALNLISDPLKILSTLEYITVASQGVIQFETLTESTGIKLTSKYQYSYSTTKTGTYSAWADCGDTSIENRVIATGPAYMSPNFVQTLYVSSDMSSVVANDWVRIRLTHFPELKKIINRSDYFVVVSSDQERTVLSTVADATSLTRGAIALANNTVAIAATDSSKALTPSSGAALINSVIPTGSRVPGGGANNYVLAKTGAANGATGWVAQSGNSGGGGSVPNANTTTAGKLRFATNAESTANTLSNSIGMTPQTTKRTINSVITPGERVPGGGANNYVLAKTGAANGATGWVAQSGNGGGGGGGGSANTLWNDNAQVQLGTGADLKLYHNGTNNHILNTTDLYIKTDTSGITKNAITVNKNGSIDLFYNDSRKLATTLAGVTVFGTVTANAFSGNGAGLTGISGTGGGAANTLWDDHAQVQLGTGADMKLYHNSAANYIDNGSNLFIRSGTNKAIFAQKDAGVTLYFNGVKKLETSNTGINANGTIVANSFSGNGASVTSVNAAKLGDIEIGGFVRANSADTISANTRWLDNDQIQLGDGKDLKLYHNGTDNYIDNASDLYIRSGSDTSIFANTDGEVSLYYNGTKKLETSNTGVTVAGTLTANAFSGNGAGLTSLPSGGGGAANTLWKDLAQVQLGTGADMRLYHQGGNHNVNYIDNDTTLAIRTGTENAILIRKDLDVELYYNGVKKLETSNTGVTVAGTLTANAFSGNGALLTSLPSGGGGGGGAANTLWNDNVQAQFGNTAQMRIYRSVAAGEANTNTIKTTESFQIQHNNDRAFLIHDNFTTLGYSSNGQITTTATGVSIKGALTANSSAVISGNTTIKGSLVVGTTDDNVSITSNSSVSSLTTTAGDLYIKTGSDTSIFANTDGEVSLYYNGVKKLETSNTGVTVAGTLTANSFAGDGSALTGITGGGSVPNANTTTAGKLRFATNTEINSANSNSIGMSPLGVLRSIDLQIPVGSRVPDGGDIDAVLMKTGAGNGSIGWGLLPALGGSANTLWSDNAQVQLGTGADLKLYHNGTDNYIDNASDLYIRMGTETALKANTDGEVSLYYNGVKKLETSNTGASVTGVMAATSFTGDGSALTGITGGSNSGSANVRTTFSTFKWQVGDDNNAVTNNTWAILKNADGTEVITDPEKITSASQTIWVLSSGVAYCSNGPIASIGLEMKAQYSYANTETGTYSSFRDIVPGNGESDNLFFRSKIASGGTGNGQYRDYSPATQFPQAISTAMPLVSAGDFIKVRMSHRIPASTGFQTLAKRYDWYLGLQIEETITVTASIGNANTSTYGATQYSTETENATGTAVDKSPNVLGARGMFAKPLYESPETALAGDNTAQVFTHGLGRQPYLYKVFLRCKVAGMGFAVGDEIDCSFSPEAFNQAMASATQIKTTVGISYFNPTSNVTHQAITSANWRIIVRAW